MKESSKHVSNKWPLKSNV